MRRWRRPSAAPRRRAPARNVIRPAIRESIPGDAAQAPAGWPNESAKPALSRRPLHVLQQRVSLYRLHQGALTQRRELIVFSRRPLFRQRLALLLPGGLNQPELLQPSQRWINGAAGQTRRFHHVESIAIPGAECLKYQRRGVG